jgi:LuxR family maltose regulon positive regulatory protein
VGALSLAANDLDDIVIARARWEITFGNPAKAQTGLERAMAAATAASRHQRALKLRLLAALALERSGNVGAAVAMAEPALRHACQEGFVRLVLDEGPAIGRLLEHCRPLANACAGRRDDPILGEYLQQLIQTLGPLPVPESATSLLEPLTRKEIRVLQLLAEGYSNSAMAEKLFVSDSTVRTHLRNINGKLNAHSRTEAVAIARKLGVMQ